MIENLMKAKKFPKAGTTSGNFETQKLYLPQANC